MWLYCQTGMEDGLKEEFIFFECLLFGALISATDPGLLTLLLIIFIQKLTFFILLPIILPDYSTSYVLPVNSLVSSCTHRAAPLIQFLLEIPTDREDINRFCKSAFST